MIVSAGQTFLGRYKVLKCLNRNTRSSVFLARDEFKRNRSVVLKFVRNYGGDAKFHQREVAAYKQTWLRDSSNPLLIDEGKVEGGWLYLIREHKMGVSLSDRSTIHFSELITLFHSCLSTLESYARAGLLHGDVKPANIIFDNAEPNAGGRLIDPLGFNVSEDGHVTPQLGAGTKEYVHPDERSPLIPDPTRDVYGAGISFLLTLQARPERYKHYPFAKKIELLCRTACNSLAARYSSIREMREALDGLIDGLDARFFTDFEMRVVD